MAGAKPRRVLPAALLAVFVVAWLVLAIAPSYRQDWALENVLVFVAVPWLAWSYRRFQFSNLAYGTMFVFFLLHEIGAHYTYAEVPYDRFLVDHFGFSLDAALGFSRNHYDRLVHGLAGVLLAPAVLELLDARTRPRGVWRMLLPVALVLSTSALFELFEWLAALVFGGDLGVAYLGTQGDVWDAQKDMVLALLGAVFSTTLCNVFRRRPELAA